MNPPTSTPPPRDVAAVRTRAWRDGILIAEDFPVADVSEHLDADPNVIVWVDLCEPDRDELLVLGEELSLHELAVEDALGPHQRPKLDHYDTHQFLSIHAVRLDPDTGELDETEIDAFINARWIITIRKNDRFPIEPVVQRWDRSAALARHGVAFLLYGLLDHVVDQYFAAIDREALRSWLAASVARFATGPTAPTGIIGLNPLVWQRVFRIDEHRYVL